MSIQHRGSNSLKQIKLHIAAWNIRILLDEPGRHERRTAIIGRELGRYNIDIAALSEMRISGESEFVESGLHVILYRQTRRSTQTSRSWLCSQIIDAAVY